MIFFKNHYKLIGAFLMLILAFMISRLPFFIYFPIVGFHSDTAVYFAAVEGLLYGELPKFGTVPPLYPLFLWFVGLLSDNMLIYAYVQTFFSLCSGLFFLYISYKHMPKLCIPFAMALSVFFMTSHSLVFDSLLTSESLYVSILICLCALFLHALYTSKKWAWILFSVFLSLPFLIRPTGLFFLMFLFAICLYFFYTKVKRVYYFYFLLPFCAVFFINMLYSKITLNEFIPDRIVTYLPHKQYDQYASALKSYQGKSKPYTREEWEETIRIENSFMDEQKANSTHKVYTSKFMRYLVFINAISYESRPFYTNELYRRYHDYYVNNYMDKTFHHNGFNITPFSDAFKSFMFKNYYKKLPSILFSEVADVKNNPESKMSNHFFYKTYNFYYKTLGLGLFRHKIWIFFTAFAVVLALFKTYISKAQDKTALFILFATAILYATGLVMVFTGHNSGSWRYTFPTEFIVYMASAYLLMDVRFILEKFRMVLKR